MSWAYGAHTVESLLRESPESVEELWLVRSRKPSPARERVRALAERERVRVREVEDAALGRALGDVAHQGIAARVGEFSYADAPTLLKVDGPSVILVLDEVQDPHNLGAVIRSAAAFGVQGIVIPRHRSAAVTPTVRKVAVGAERRVPIAQVVNCTRFIEDAKAAGFWVYGAVVDAPTPLWSTDFSEKSVLVVGSEGRGVRPSVAAACDMTVGIPMVAAESLNVSVAAGVLLYEWRRRHAV